jgi:V/A-type H+-transporting ATPase subunit D
MPARAPSKAELLEMRDEMRLVAQGKGILEEQRDLLAHRIMDLLRTGAALQQDYANEIAAAGQALREAVLRHGLSGVGSYERTQTAWPAPQWQRHNVFGCVLVEDQSDGEPLARPELGDGWEVSLELERALVHFHRLSGLAVPMAALQNNLGRLTRAFVRTQRRVNALENIILPELRQAIRDTENMLDEMERESLVRIHTARR